MQRKTLVLFGKRAPDAYSALDKDPTVQTHVVHEREAHKHTHNTPRFLDFEYDNISYHVMCIEPEFFSSNQKKGVLQKVQHAIENANVVVLCPESVKTRSGQLQKTISDLAIFKKKHPIKCAETVTLLPDYFDSVTSKNALASFFENCHYHPVHVVRTHANLFALKKYVGEVVASKKPDVPMHQAPGISRSNT